MAPEDIAEDNTAAMAAAAMKAAKDPKNFGKIVCNAAKTILVSQLDKTIAVLLTAQIVLLTGLNAGSSDRPEATILLALAALSQSIGTSLSIASMFAGPLLFILKKLKMNADRFKYLLLLGNFGNACFVFVIIIYGGIVYIPQYSPKPPDPKVEWDDGEEGNPVVLSAIYIWIACGVGQTILTTRALRNFYLSRSKARQVAPMKPAKEGRAEKVAAMAENANEAKESMESIVPGED